MIPPEAGFRLIHQSQCYTAEDFSRLQEPLRHCLQALGLKPGMTLVCRFRDRFLYAQLLFLLPRMGCLFLPLDPDLPSAISGKLLNAAGEHILLQDGAALRNPDHKCHGSVAEQPLESGAPCLLLATSGTTGRPRLVELTGDALQHSARAACDFLQLEQGDRWLACLPLHHIGGLSVLLRCAWRGATAVLADGFSPRHVLQQLYEYRITHVSLVPTMLYRLLEQKTRPPDSLRVVLLGGASSSQSLVDEAMQKDWPVCPSYGLTEAASQVATVYPPKPGWQEGEAGMPLPHMELEVQEQTGAIRIRGPSVACCYRQETGARFPLLDADDWLDTGDVGWLDDASGLHVVGRRDDMLISGGENIHPAIVEGVFSECPGVGQVAVTALNDACWGDALVLLYQGTALPETVKRWARERLRAGFLPRYMLPVDELPRNALGKLLRSELKQIARERLQSVKA
ncbi:class I adenylate-forming enzyme family protein [Thiolapillus brandeum]|uniref:O-succinylbenzoic acid--CoA ligase n=1 Tax=Thiolapillus brandeum TaxID=1076588 RepID=A0A7U6JGE5_9GAMM|nr:class I adenylate-forming enzyme family protein [Thiolapillus brandeum]BAO43554.1 O-succinylbenzoic acid--CoA ligase [Thiolapillus brandeum]